MSTVARFSTDSFLPSGSLDHNGHIPFPGLVSSGDSSSVISPLALPRGATGFFDHLSVPAASSTVHSERANGAACPQANKVYSSLSPSFRGFPRSQSPQFLSPTLASTANHPRYQLQLQPRPASVNGSSVDQVAIGASGTPATVQYGPVDAIVEHSQQHNAIQRLLHQNTRIRGAWEAERKYLEANRERAEEVYREEQALMEEDRIAWDTERVQLLQQIESLRKERSEWAAERANLVHQVEVLRQTVSSLRRSDPSPIASRNGSADSGVRGVDGSQESREAPFHSSSQNIPLAPIQTGASRTGLSENTSFPRLEPSSSSSRMSAPIPGPTSFADAMASQDKVDAGPVPIVDVQEIHPDLEGIPIKAHAIQKPTFTDGPSPVASRSASRTQSPTEAGKPVVARQESKNQTLEVLAARASDRLTMHAGHTPSHSLSILPTATGSAMHTASSSGGRTPTNGPSHAGEGAIPSADGASSNQPTTPPSEPPAPAPTQQDVAGSEEDPEALLDASEDPELKGPLMVRNIPAKDDIFFRKLSDQLLKVSESPEIAIPAVLKQPSDEEASQMDETEAGVDGASEHIEAPGKDKSPINEGNEPENNSPSNGGDELEIPLKIKKSSNFGAPFGECR